ncbi:hypothetical protein Hdeb2414_s0022g00613651 [Helianthus debilis subsp. tardiflorus]
MVHEFSRPALAFHPQFFTQRKLVVLISANSLEISTGLLEKTTSFRNFHIL